MLDMILAQRQQVIKTFSTREAAGEALYHLILLGFPLSQVFLLGNGAERNLQPNALPAKVYGTVTGTVTGLKQGMLRGNLVGAVIGLMLGAALTNLPNVGHLTILETITFVLLSGGVCTAAGGLIGSLIGLGRTTAQAKTFSQQTAKGNILLIVEGTAQNIDLARKLLQRSID